MKLNKIFIENLNLSSGIISYNDFSIHESVEFKEQKYSFKEDLLQIKFGDRFILDVGWLPEFNENGCFVIKIILDNDWINPVKEIKCKTVANLKKVIEKTALLINKKIKNKNLPYRNIEYEEFE